ncbi:MAG TPA: hypothetical protein VGD64_03380 [Acidisarcina sp.]
MSMSECGSLTLPRVWEIFDYFQISPPQIAGSASRLQPSRVSAA